MWLFGGATTVMDLNEATLSGCMDIIVVDQPRYELKSTPFHVRFGKGKVLRSRQKRVTIKVNEEEKELFMTLGAAGEAYFEFEADDEHEEETTYIIPPDEETLSPERGANSPPSNEFADSYTDREQSSPHRVNVEFSLSGHLLSGSLGDETFDKDRFEANYVSYDSLDRDPTRWYDPSLVARFDGQPPYYPGKTVLPLLASLHVFNRPLSTEAVQRLNTVILSATWPRFEHSPRRPTADGLEEMETSESFTDLPTSSSIQATERELETPLFLPNDPAKRTWRSLRPRSDDLKALGLRPGANKITFTVTSSLQGEKEVTGTIYYWSSDTKIVVSDVDGTITRSDLLGQLAPIFGKDHSHPGVAELFTRIHDNGYKLLYLTARAIGQADATRDYLFEGLAQEGQNQDKWMLPPGPLICSPDRLFDSFKREVIDRRPYEFKIAALRDIRKLFPNNYNPFTAGFGNRDTDHRAYVYNGIPEARIFIVEPKGDIHHLNKITKYSDYPYMSTMCEAIFPVPRDGIRRTNDDMVDEDDKCNSFNYWRVPLAPFEEPSGGSQPAAL